MKLQQELRSRLVDQLITKKILVSSNHTNDKMLSSY